MRATEQRGDMCTWAKKHMLFLAVVCLVARATEVNQWVDVPVMHGGNSLLDNYLAVVLRAYPTSSSAGYAPRRKKSVRRREEGGECESTRRGGGV